MKIRLNRDNNQYNIIDDKEQVAGTAIEAFQGKGWILQMNDNPVSIKFEKLSDVTKYVVKL